MYPAELNPAGICTLKEYVPWRNMYPAGLYPAGFYPAGLYSAGLYLVGLYPAGLYSDGMTKIKENRD